MNYGYDGGGCSMSWYNCTAIETSKVSAECSNIDYMNEECDLECNFEECNYDRGSCLYECYLEGCELRSLGDGECQEECFTRECMFDNFDCFDKDTSQLTSAE